MLLGFDYRQLVPVFYGMSVVSLHSIWKYKKKVTVNRADKMSSIVDYTDRSTCIILEMVQVQYCLTKL
jgi:hypothetical protein